MFLYLDKEGAMKPERYDYYLSRMGIFTPALPDGLPMGGEVTVMLEADEDQQPFPPQQDALRQMLSLCRHEVNYAFRPTVYEMQDSEDGWYSRTYP
ncbi:MULTISPECIES: hypothetical protein [Rhizobium/Agrobacterium group]|nr:MULTISPECIES: hypothetical protein [Rhizobium/Agrobacterium group]